MRDSLSTVCLTIAVVGFCTTAKGADDPLFHSTDSLAPRDGWGRLHQSRVVNETDRAGRYHWRPFYYLETHKTLLDHPAYIGAAQTALQRYGYYCGEIDGVPSPEFTEAIARLQKNHSMRVTGTLTRPVRRVLFLP